MKNIITIHRNTYFLRKIIFKLFSKRDFRFVDFFESKTGAT